MRNRTLASLAAALAMATLAAPPAPAQSTAQVGTLSCDVSAGVGMILMQKQTMTCLFTPRTGARPNLTSDASTSSAWRSAPSARAVLFGSVVAPATGVPRGALSGTYTGVGAQASVGAGVGANVLVGGTGRSFSLQPVSVEGQTGLNIAGGVTTVTLLPPPPPPTK